MDFNVNVNVKFDATPALAGIVSTLAGATRRAEVIEPTKLPPAQLDMPAVEVAQAEAKVEAVQEPASTPEQPKEITGEQLRALVGPKIKEFGKEKVFNILDEFGVKRVPDLNQEQRVAFVEKLNAL